MTHTKTSESQSDEEARRELYALLHRNLSRNHAIERVVEVGSTYLGIEHGHITNIDEGENRWEVIGSTDPPDGPYPDGLTAKLSDSYCRRTIQQSSPIALHDADDQGWSDDHAYQLHQLDTYLGIRIEVFGEPYGTICFVESAPREDPFSKDERFFIELAGQVLRKLLEESHREKDLDNRDRLISVLNRVLRHNIRNDLNVIQGNARMLKERLSGEDARVASHIDATTTELLSIAENSRELENLTRSVPVSRPMDVVPIVEAAVTDMQTEFPAASLSLDAPDEAVAFAAPQLEEGLSELLANAADYAGENPTIEVNVLQGTDRTTVQITDDGPGLPPDERRILTGASETALDHGSGIGLTLVYWVVVNLDGEIDVETSSSGTTVEIHLQRAASTTSG